MRGGCWYIWSSAGEMGRNRDGTRSDGNAM